MHCWRQEDGAPCVLVQTVSCCSGDPAPPSLRSLPNTDPPTTSILFYPVKRSDHVPLHLPIQGKEQTPEEAVKAVDKHQVLGAIDAAAQCLFDSEAKTPHHIRIIKDYKERLVSMTYDLIRSMELPLKKFENHPWNRADILSMFRLDTFDKALEGQKKELAGDQKASTYWSWLDSIKWYTLTTCTACNDRAC